jgi:hypothetical protein
MKLMYWQNGGLELHLQDIHLLTASLVEIYGALQGMDE